MEEAGDLRPEQRARRRIDAMLQAAGWAVQDHTAVNLYAGRGVAVREFRTTRGPADYVLYVDRQALGVIEAKPQGTTLSGVEPQTHRYQQHFPDALPACLVDGCLPFGYESTAEETWFTCRFDPEPSARRVFWFHRPETLAEQAAEWVHRRPASLRAWIARMPALEADPYWLRAAQAEAISNLERSLRDHKSRALIQMATGAGKTFCAANISERLLRLAQARRVLFLVDRANLGRQTLREFQGFAVPGDGRKFTELYNVQHLTHNQLDRHASVCIATIQRVYSMLRGEPDLDEATEEAAGFEVAPSRPVEVDYNPALPIDAFDVVIVDECHRSIYGVWRQVLEYFDAVVIGLTATPGKQTLGFFGRNLVMEYGFPRAVADGVNVDFDVFRLATAITEGGSEIEAGYVTTFRDRETRAERQDLVDQDLTYGAADLDRKVVAKDQIRTVLRTIRDHLPAIFPDREGDEFGRLRHIPKTVIFAKHDSHAEDIVRIAREEFGKGNDHIVKITYRSSDGGTPEELLAAFRNAYQPRIAVTVDMIATGTDVKPIEVLVFMRMIRSRSYFEQMKGRGVRTIADEDLRAVTPDAAAKDRFVLIDAVGVTDTELIESTPLERKRGVALAKLLRQLSYGQVSQDVVSSLSSRLARLDRRLGPVERSRVAELAGMSLTELNHRLVDALDPDRQRESARQATGAQEPDPDAVAAARRALLEEAVRPLAANPELRQALTDVQRSLEQVIDELSIDVVTRAEFAVDAKARAAETVASFQAFLEQHRDEITWRQALYSRPYAQRLRYQDVRELAEVIGRPPHRWTAERLWEAYETLDASEVRGSAGTMLTNIVSLVRFALGLDDHLAPYAERVEERFNTWLLQQENAGRAFTPEQREWLGLIRDHLAASLSIEPHEFADPPFAQRGGLHRARELFGTQLTALLDELTEAAVG